MTEMEEELRPCTVCGKPVLWGTRHSVCGRRVMAAPARAAAPSREFIEWADDFCNRLGHAPTPWDAWQEARNAGVAVDRHQTISQQTPVPGRDEPA